MKYEEALKPMTDRMIELEAKIEELEFYKKLTATLTANKLEEVIGIYEKENAELSMMISNEKEGFEKEIESLKEKLEECGKYKTESIQLTAKYIKQSAYLENSLQQCVEALQEIAGETWFTGKMIPSEEANELCKMASEALARVRRQ